MSLNWLNSIGKVVCQNWIYCPTYRKVICLKWMYGPRHRQGSVPKLDPFFVTCEYAFQAHHRKTFTKCCTCHKNSPYPAPATESDAQTWD